MSAHNFSTVLSFELRRTLLRPIYWLTTLSVPALMAIIVALSFFSGSTAADRAQSAGDRVSFQYVDASGIVAADVATRLGGHPPRIRPPQRAPSSRAPWTPSCRFLRIRSPIR